MTNPVAQPASVQDRAAHLLREHQQLIWRRTDRLFAGLLGFEWLAGILFVVVRSPRTWDGATSSVHPHVWLALLLGAGIIALPIVLAFLMPGRSLTRQIIAIGQMLMSGLFTHLGDGRIEMHFHVFGSLAFLAFYRDWRVLITGSLVVSLDHLCRGLILPETIYGISAATVWRTLEHAGWVIFEDIFLIASCIQSVREMKGIAENRARLEDSYQRVEEIVGQRTQQLKEAQDDLVKVARSAGMAEIATSVLHNVGNVLNSVNVSASVVADKLRKSEVASLTRVGDLIRTHETDLPVFLTTDARGKLIPGFVAELATCIGQEQESMLAEIASLTKGIDHIKQIVSAQQSLAKRSTVCTLVEPAALMETALTMQLSSVGSDIQVVRHIAAIQPVLLDQHKVIQILVNLISNAVHAVRNGPGPLRQITLEVLTVPVKDSPGVRFSVTDTGVGIAPENLTRIFSHGFTTKTDGHGFGLHSAANAATEMGGRLSAHSDGPGRGATFTLELPLESKQTVGEPCSQ